MVLDLNGIDGLGMSYDNSLTADSLSKVDSENATDEELMEACKGFETYFLEQVFKEMKKTVHSSDDDNQYMQYFGDTLVQEYAEKTTESGEIGLAKQLYESMKHSGVMPGSV